MTLINFEQGSTVDLTPFFLTAILNILETFSTIGEAEGDVASFVSFIFQLFHDDSYDKYIL